jgi:hypothetical protein
MTHPGADQIVKSVTDLQRALRDTRPGMFDPLWYQLTPRGRIPGALFFHPGFSPDLAMTARRWHDHAREAIAEGRVTYEFPFGAGRRTDTEDRSDDPLVFFAADLLNRGPLRAYVLNNTPNADQQHTEMIAAMGGNDFHETAVTHDGKLIVRLSDLLLEHYQRRGNSVEPPNFVYLRTAQLMTPAERFMYQLHFGTLTTDRCDLDLDVHCRGRTVYVPAFFAGLSVMVEVCEGCYNTTRDTISDNYREQVAEAWRNPPVPKWGVRGA